MNHRLTVWSILTVAAMSLAACGGSDPGASDPVGTHTNPPPSTTQAPGAGGGDNVGDAASAPSGPIEMNSIRVGGETWTRVLDGSGQCFLPAEDGGNPVDGTVWGTAEPGGVNFTVDYGEASGNPTQASVEGSDFWWVARGDDLVIEFDHAAMTISGSGTFENQLLAEDPRLGDFLFQCEADN